MSTTGKSAHQYMNDGHPFSRRQESTVRQASPTVRLPERAAASGSEIELDDAYFERLAEEEALAFLPRPDVH
jgi:hypothetical protein